MKLHALLAAFVLPVAVMFIVTGAFYTWGIKGAYRDDVHEISLGEPIKSDASELTDIAKSELAKLDINHPEGEAKLKKYGSHFFLEWTGSSKDVILEPTEDPLVAKLTVKHTSWYRDFVQLHKAKGGTAFKFYAAFLAVSIAILLISGFLMAWKTPALKRNAVIASGAGLLTFVVFVWFS